MDEIEYVPIDDGLKESSNPKNFPVATIREIRDRDGQRCRCCGRTNVLFETIPHHIFRKSEIDASLANKAENGAVICKQCHRWIHQGSNKFEIQYGKIFDAKLKMESIAMFKDSKIDQQDFKKLYEICRKRGVFDAAVELKTGDFDGVLFLT